MTILPQERYSLQSYIDVSKGERSREEDMFEKYHNRTTTQNII